MAGNVSQWVQDCYHKSYDEVPPDGKAWEQASCSAYVARGGSWHVDARRIRSAYRAWGLLPHNTIGFRLARTD
jgi:formylglycine-generating enzyme required for sulfatase activity